MARNFDSDLFRLLEVMELHAADRHLLQPELHRLLHDMRDAGVAVPERLADLDRKLVDEGVEAQFDNLPV